METKDVNEYNKLLLWVKWFKFGFKCAPFLFSGQLLMVIVSAIISGLITIYSGLILDSATNYLSGQNTFIWNILFILLGCFIASAVFEILDNYLSIKRNMRINMANSEKMIDTIGNSDYLTLQKPEYLKKLERAKQVVRSNSSQDDALIILQTIAGFTVSAVIIHSVAELGILEITLMLFIILATVVASIYKTKIEHRLFDNLWEKTLYRSHIGFIPHSLSASKEMRIFNFRDYILYAWGHVTKDVEFIKMRTTIKNKLIISAVCLLPYLATGLFITTMYVNSTLTSIGQFSIILSSLIMILTSSNFFALILSNVYRTSIGYCYFEDFVDYSNALKSKTVLLENERTLDCTSSQFISVRDISFKYPNKDYEALQNISFTIHEGETVAIVGENGSGKSTLINLLVGLYKPTDGILTVAGNDPWIDLNINKETKCAVIMQNFAIYDAINLEDNILLGKKKPENWLEINQAVAWDVPEEVMNDIIGDSFGGRNLSGGQWQKVALMRPLAHDKPILVLDEPTSALDPIAERQLFSEILELNKERTIIFVTHRLGSVRNADKIVVLKEGALVEMGSHTDLMKIQNGVYKSMFEAQSSWYTTGGLQVATI